MKQLLQKVVLSFVLAATFLLAMPFAVLADTSDSTTYGGGNYGSCNYGSCSITLTSGGSTTLDVLPTAGGKCTVQSDTASVFTNSDTGYTLTMTTSTTNSSLVGSTSSISAASGTTASPVALSMNKWGFRVDGVGGFGSGPTASQTNGAIPSLPFAGVPASNQTSATLATSVSPANPAVNTVVWYGLCANASLPADTYASTIVYTAVTN